ncbi:MAG: hypothetical protein HYZ43_13050 [Flavobacteriia bacterium]|nr:hypothetical protein [Flavobacteriia bacterium]
MKALTYKLVIPLTIILFGSVTKWWSVIIVDGPDDIMIGFPFPFVSSGLHTSMSLRLFLLELFIDFHIYFIILFSLIFCVNRFLIKIKPNKLVIICLYGMAMFYIIGGSFLVSNPDNLFYPKRDFDVEILDTGFKFTWQHKER